MDSRGPIFDGKVILFVKDTEHLMRIVDKLKRVPGVHSVDRLAG